GWNRAADRLLSPGGDGGHGRPPYWLAASFAPGAVPGSPGSSSWRPGSASQSATSWAGTSMTGHRALNRTYWLAVPGSIHLPALDASTISCAPVSMAVSMITRLARPSETLTSVLAACSSSSVVTVSRKANSVAAFCSPVVCVAADG